MIHGPYDQEPVALFDQVLEADGTNHAEELLRQALTDAQVELGVYDERIRRWPGSE